MLAYIWQENSSLSDLFSFLTASESEKGKTRRLFRGGNEGPFRFDKSEDGSPWLEKQRGKTNRSAGKGN